MKKRNETKEIRCNTIITMLSQPIRTATVIGLLLILKLHSNKKLPLPSLVVLVEANKSSSNNQTHKSQHVNSKKSRVSNKKGRGSSNSSSSKRNLTDRYSDLDQNYKPQWKAQSHKRRRSRSNTIERSTASYSYDHSDNSSSNHSLNDYDNDDDFDTLQLASDSDSKKLDFKHSNTSQESSRNTALSESLYNNLSQDEHEEDIINALLSSHSDTILDSTVRNHSPLSSSLSSTTSSPRNQNDIHHRQIHRKAKVSKSKKKSHSTTTTQSSPSSKKRKRRKSSSQMSIKSHGENDTTTNRRDGDGENIPIQIINSGENLHDEQTLISLSSSIPTVSSYMNQSGSVSVDIHQSQSSVPTANMPSTNTSTTMNASPSRTISRKLETFQNTIRPYFSNYLHGPKNDHKSDGTFSTPNDGTHHGDTSRSGVSVDEVQTSPSVSLISTSAPNIHTSTSTSTAYPPTTQSMFTNTHIHIQQQQTTSSYPSKETTAIMQTDSHTSLQMNKQEGTMNPNFSQSSTLYSSQLLPPQSSNVNEQGLRNNKDVNSMESSNMPLRSFPPSSSKPLPHADSTIQPNQLRQQQPQPQQQVVSKSNFPSSNSNKLLPTTMSMTTPWARKFILSRPKDALLPVPRDFLQDGFNLVQLAPIVEQAVLHSSPIPLQHEHHHGQQQLQSNQQFSLYKAALRLILGEDEHDSTTNSNNPNPNTINNMNSKSSSTTSTATTAQSRNHHLTHHEYYTPKQIYKAAEVLYTLAHARYVSSPRGLETVRRMFQKHDSTATSLLSSSSSATTLEKDDHASITSSAGKPLEYDAMMTEAIFGRCTRLKCKGMPLLPYGISDDYDVNGTGGMYRKCMRYCCSCGEAFYLWESKVDGSSWGPSFCHLFLLTYGNEIYPILSSSQRKKSSVVDNDTTTNRKNDKNINNNFIQPKIFGFRIHPNAVIRYPYI